jgi:molecular chaperone GrpE (heat shock protein)
MFVFVLTCTSIKTVNAQEKEKTSTSVSSSGMAVPNAESNNNPKSKERKTQITEIEEKTDDDNSSDNTKQSELSTKSPDSEEKNNYTNKNKQGMSPDDSSFDESKKSVEPPKNHDRTEPNIEDSQANKKLESNLSDEVLWIVIIVFSTLLLLLFICVIYLCIFFTHKKNLLALNTKISELKRKQVETGNQLKTSLALRGHGANNNDEYNLLSGRVSLLERKIKNVIQQFDGLEGIVINEPTVREPGKLNTIGEIKPPIEPDIPFRLRLTVNTKIDKDKERSIALKDFITKLGKSDAELSNYIEVLKSPLRNIQDYEAIESTELVLARKFQNYIELVDVSNMEQLQLVRELSGTFDISLIEPETGMKFDATIHSAKGEEDSNDIPKGRLIRTDILGYQDAQAVIVRAKVILSRG